MTKPVLELADILRQYRVSFEKLHPSLKIQRRALHAIEVCRTAALGQHIDECDGCGHIRISYNSCRNRHCPKCQVTNREKWIQAREQDLLPVPYLHLVFTLPVELNVYCLSYPAAMYSMLFESASQTLADLAADSRHLGAQPGMIAVLHTWGQNLSLHPHIHMIVPGGGVDEAGNWIKAKCNGRFLFPGKVVSALYRGKFMDKLTRFLNETGKPMNVPLRRMLYGKHWVVDARIPFLGPKQVIEYLGRYTHRVAISNHRLKKLENGEVTFSYKDYADNSKQKLMTLKAEEFVRRFCLHILPDGFVRLRHYGILSNRNKKRLKLLQMKMGTQIMKKEKLSWKQVTLQRLNFDVDACPCCKTGRMIRIMSFEANAPPQKVTAFIATRKKAIKNNER